MLLKSVSFNVDQYPKTALQYVPCAVGTRMGNRALMWSFAEGFSFCHYLLSTGGAEETKM